MSNMHDTMAEALHRMKSIHYWSLISGMTPAEIYLLAAICDEGREAKKVSDLCEVCDMQPTAVSRLMNSLEEKGLILRSARKGDRRVTEVEATSAGRESNEHNRAVLHDYWDQVLADVPAADVETMLRVLNEIMSSMEHVLTAKMCEREKGNH